jgi:TatD DNase family protein
LPQYVREVAEFLADLRGVSYDRFAEQTTDNFQRLFSLAQLGSVDANERATLLRQQSLDRS